MRVNIVWFKRDLKVWDHEALATAAVVGPVLPLHSRASPWRSQTSAPDSMARFLMESLEALSASLARLGQSLIIRTGDAVEILAELAAAHDISGNLCTSGNLEWLDL